MLVGIALNLSAQTITTFDAPGATDTRPAAINARGQITGYYLDAKKMYHAFLRECDGALTNIDVPGSTINMATGINARGQITVSSESRAYIRQRDGSLTTFDIPDEDVGGFHWHTFQTFGKAIGPAGEIWHGCYSSRPAGGRNCGGPASLHGA